MNPSSQTVTEAAAAVDALTFQRTSKTLHSAILATRLERFENASQELMKLSQTRAFEILVSAVQQLAQSESISEADAAQTLTRTFRDLDRIWGEYLMHEGYDRIRSQPN